MNGFSYSVSKSGVPPKNPTLADGGIDKKRSTSALLRYQGWNSKQLSVIGAGEVAVLIDGRRVPSPRHGMQRAAPHCVRLRVRASHSPPCAAAGLTLRWRDVWSGPRSAEIPAVILPGYAVAVRSDAIKIVADIVHEHDRLLEY
jgi:hypothetical protein